NQPIIGAHFDTDGIHFDQDVLCEPFYSIFDNPATDYDEAFSVAVGDGPNIFNAFVLNDVDSLLNNLPDPLNGEGPLTTRPTLIFEQVPYIPLPPVYKVNYHGYHIADSTLFDTGYAVFDDVEGV